MGRPSICLCESNSRQSKSQWQEIHGGEAMLVFQLRGFMPMFEHEYLCSVFIGQIFQYIVQFRIVRVISRIVRFLLRLRAIVAVIAVIRSACIYQFSQLLATLFDLLLSVFVALFLFLPVIVILAGQ